MKTKQTHITSPPARERILLTAHDLFYADGIRATGIDRIIKESKVTKVTFYRHFPSKNDLIIAFLNYRHQRWMTWFTDTLKRHGNSLEALSPTLLEWFASAHYRGCAFINSVGELGETLSEVNQISHQHKHDMTVVIKDLLPESAERNKIANALALAIDGAVIRAQIDQKPETAIEGFNTIVAAFSSDNES